MEAKETEEQTANRIYKEYTKGWSDERQLQAESCIAMMLLFSAERKRIEAPSDEEIQTKAFEYLAKQGSIRYKNECEHDFTEGFKAAIKLLTGL